MNQKNKIKILTKTAMIAGIYTALTMATFYISFGAIQYRVSEALTILPVYAGYAVPGLTLGCALANFVGFLIGANPTGLVDVLFGTFATLLAAMSTRAIGKSSKRWVRYVFAPLPPVLINAVIVGFEISYVFMGSTEPAILLVNGLSVLIGQLVICYGLGVPLMMLLDKHERYQRIF